MKIEHLQLALDVLREVRDGELLPAAQETMPSTGGPDLWVDLNWRDGELHRTIEEFEDELAEPRCQAA